tara:strand:- start:168 stop:830 length:663 start_codon:yes stop_codon:yes gene_type:complete
MNIETYLYFISLCLIINLTPGPGMLYVLTQTLSKGRASGICSAVGLEVGCLFHVFLVVFGITTVFIQYPYALTVLKWSGALYLLYLAFEEFQYAYKKNQLSVQKTYQLPSNASQSLWNIFKKGVIVDVLNPKVALFILAFIPQFIATDKTNDYLSILFLGLTFSLTGTIVHVLIALFSDKLKVILLTQKTNNIYVSLASHIVPGVIFVMLAVSSVVSMSS